MDSGDSLSCNLLYNYRINQYLRRLSRFSRFSLLSRFSRFPRFSCPAFVRPTSARHGPASACPASLVQRRSSRSGVHSSLSCICLTSVARPCPASARPESPVPFRHPCVRRLPVPVRHPSVRRCRPPPVRRPSVLELIRVPWFPAPIPFRRRYSERRRLHGGKRMAVNAWWRVHGGE